MPRFLHTADWQIGRQYGQFDPEDAALLAQARLDAVEAIARRAAAERVDAVLVAGDVFDMQDVADRTIRRLFQLLEAFAGPWVLIAGNHDAALGAGVWRRARDLGCVPANVHVPAAPGVIELAQAGLAVLAAPLTQRHTYDDVTAAFDAMPSAPGLVRVGLAHGSVTGRLPEGVDSANPIAPDRAARARLDYLALGDWHGCLEIDARTWYAGTPEQDRFRGNAPGHVLDVGIAAPGAQPRVTPVRVGRYAWHTWEVRLGLPGDVEALAVRLDALGDTDVLQLVLAGTLGMAAQQALEAALGRAEARVRALRLDAAGLVLEPDGEDLAALAGSPWLAEVALALRRLEDDPAQGEIAREALRALVRLHRAEDAA